MRSVNGQDHSSKKPSSSAWPAAVRVGTIGMALLLAGCNEPQSTDGRSASKEPERKTGDYVAYDGPSEQTAFATRYKAHCSSWGECISELQPSSAPIKKSDGDPLCVIPQYGRHFVLVAYFSRDDVFRGASCQISEAEYEAIISHHGRYNVFKKYLDQRSYEGFLTWRTQAGFVTIYKEVQRRSPNGGVIYEYYTYTGPDEHPHYAKFVAN